MKTATIPPLRVAPELRRNAEDVLRPGETLSAFVAESIRRHVAARQAQAAFLARGLAAAAAARESGDYAAAADVLDELGRRLERARKGS